MSVAGPGRSTRPGACSGPGRAAPQPYTAPDRVRATPPTTAWAKVAAGSGSRTSAPSTHPSDGGSPS